MTSSSDRRAILVVLKESDDGVVVVVVVAGVGLGAVDAAGLAVLRSAGRGAGVGAGTTGARPRGTCSKFGKSNGDEAGINGGGNESS